jgi:antitoxin (DNA-binding transcriptional repressor) of toxin-antitoxin stability system
MIRLNIHEAKTHLSRYLAKMRGDDRILLCRRNAPVAEIRLLAKPASRPRALGLAKGTVRIPPSFNDPLPEDELTLFDGAER